MKTRLSVSLSMLGLSMLAAVIPGCAADRIDLVNTGMLTLEKQATSFYQLLVKYIPLRIKGDLQSVTHITTVRVLVAIMGSPTTHTHKNQT